jgi:hypothetical protein
MYQEITDSVKKLLLPSFIARKLDIKLETFIEDLKDDNSLIHKAFYDGLFEVEESLGKLFTINENSNAPDEIEIVDRKVQYYKAQLMIELYG